MGFKIGYWIGYIASRMTVGLVKLLWRGIVTSSIKRKPLLFVYLGLFVGAFISYNMTGDFTVIFLITLCVAIAFGIAEKLEPKQQDLWDYFNAVFTEIKLQEEDESTPLYLYTREISTYSKSFAFNTLIPLSEWQKKKDKMEMCINAKILNINQDEENNRVIHVTIETNPLPTMIEWDDTYINSFKNALTFGVGYAGNEEIDLDKHPHTFVAGETGSGKSNILKCLIYQALVKRYHVVLIDFKRGVSFSSFSQSVSLCFEYEDAVKVLNDMVEETKKRLDLFRENGVDNLKDYNGLVPESLPRKIIFIDELAELLKIRDKEISNALYDSLETLTRLSRAAGIHLIMGVQRPDSTIVNGQIKNNVSFRICGRFVDKEPSRIMLGNDMASKLSNIKGRFIVKGDSMEEVQCFYYTDRPLPQKTYWEKYEEEKLESEIDEFIAGLTKAKESEKPKQAVEMYTDEEILAQTKTLMFSLENLQKNQSPLQEVEKEEIKEENVSTKNLEESIVFDFSDIKINK